ncbi:MAG TPA: hypothetical protein VK430_02495 [Xanthobacteraceae bacterium]|nr:hypothetical protein [Xanthobacteraceae bacterium]
MDSLTKAIVAVSLGLFGASATSAFAQSRWDAEHPRRAEVNERLAVQNFRINQRLREGELTPAQAYRLHNEDRTIRREERAMASFDHGHITRAEQRALNQEENVVSRRIGF